MLVQTPQSPILAADVCVEDGSDFVVVAYDANLERQGTTAVQFGGDGDDIVYAIVQNDETTDLVVVGSTESTKTHLFDLDTPSEYTPAVARADKRRLTCARSTYVCPTWLSTVGVCRVTFNGW